MKIKYSRKFECDKSIAKGILWLNKHGFYTSDCCSGLETEHIEPKKMYVLFEGLGSNKKSLIYIFAREIGFTIRKMGNAIRIETNLKNKLELFNSFMDKMRMNKKGLNLRTMGISNRAYDSENKKTYSVQFYDYDYKNENITEGELKRILEIFPYDCIMYGTKQGIHFISFSLLKGLSYTKAKAIETSKALGNQDYWTQANDLTLRVSPKWKQYRFSKMYKIISKKPKFKGLVKEPNKYRISNKHLEFYFKYMDLPLWVYNKYNDCDKKDYRIKLYHYKTRD